MSGVNKVILIGNLGRDPETNYTQSGNAVTTLALATSEKWKDKQTGQPVEKTEWHRVVFFGKPAEIITEYARKGSKLYVEGSLTTRKWQDKDGNEKYTTEIRGRDFQFLGGNGEPWKAESGAEPSGNRQAASAPGGHQQNTQEDFDDDIPF